MDLFLPTSVRLLIPLLILRFPLGGFILSIIADVIDWFIFPFSDPQSYLVYQKWDKFFDMYFMTLALFVTLSIKEKTVVRILMFLYIFRLTGVVLVETFAPREILLFFPNIFLGYYLFYYAYKKFSKKKKILTTYKENVPVLILISIPTVFLEFFNHFLKKLPWQFEWGNIYIMNSTHISVFISQLIWLFFLISPPICFLLWKSKK